MENKSKLKFKFKFGIFREMICGFFMALADSVPGVSGGTVAFLAGEYDDFIGSFGNIIGKDKTLRRRSLLFLIRLGIGWIIGMGLSVTLLAGLFTTHIYAISSLFLGLVAASIPLIIAEEKETLRSFRPWHLLFFALGAGAVVGLSLLNFSVSADKINPASAIYIFISGALAISAMVLPGISGSTLLLAFGLYVPIITGLKRFFSLDLSAFPMLFIFGLGVLTGIFCSFKGISYLLKTHRTATISAIIGLMAGSLFAVVMGPTTLDEPLEPVSAATFNIGTFLLGVGIVALFTAVKYIAKRRRTNDGMDNKA